ncbi:uncharacterized protein LOC128226460 isoform X2 [Mya arenaria]|uniref:uncharacterized protein LOC128226460 isoform X2 n=1 Tax=Mya arenaria TaxID=6604 RepID=UPI0022E319A6|nr:uncharacterized protein LOC128226460 isoform X2 [Mya arenaria]
MGPVLLLIVYILYLEPTEAVRFPHINTVSQQEDVDVNISTISDRRIRSANGFPLDFEVRFTSNNVHSDLKLSINDVSDDIPVVLQRAGKMVSYRVSSEAAAFYMDVSNKAAFIVWRAGDTETDNFLFFGTYQSGDRELLVQPPTSVGADHSVAEIEETNPTETDFLVNPEFDASRVEQMVTANAKDPDRVERQATDYEVEIFFVIDYSLYSFWYMQMTGTDSEKQTSAISAIKQFYAFVLNAMSVRYSSVTGSDYTISLVYAGISIATSSTDAPYIENNLQSFDVDGRRAFLADIVLSDFKDWGNTNLKQNYYYDVAMMFTGYEMGRSVNDEFNSATAGFAYTPGACSNSKYSINEDHFRAILATVAAHELGHNLGAQHDGTVDGNGELCSSDDAYVMAPSIGVSSDAIKNIRQFSFSPCSIDYFTAYMTKLNNDGENCLATRTANYDTSDLDPYLGDLAGQVYTPDQQCEYLMGAGSYLSRISYESDYSGICSVMNCFVPGTTSSFRYKLTWEGTTCGDGKLCSGGLCVASSIAPAVANESCMFGNNPSIVTFETVTCSELLAFPNTSYECYNSRRREDCCETCEQFRLANVNNIDCPYGDRSTYCNAADCPNYSEDFKTDNCCQTCAATTTIISTRTSTAPTSAGTTPTTATSTPTTTATTSTTTATTPTITTITPTTTDTLPTTTKLTTTVTTPTKTTVKNSANIKQNLCIINSSCGILCLIIITLIFGN